MQNTIRNEFRGRLTELITKVKDDDSLSCFGTGIPGREGPETAGNKARFSDTKEEARDQKRPITLLEGLEGTDGAKQENLQSKPFTGAHAIEDHVRRDLSEHDAKGEQLLADVELILVDANIFHEFVGNGIGNVSTIELFIDWSVFGLYKS